MRISNFPVGYPINRVKIARGKGDDDSISGEGRRGKER